MAMDRLFESIKSIENDDGTQSISTQTGGGKRKRFEERYQRVTTYLERPIFLQLQAKRESGEITNITQFFNNAIRNTLENI